MEPNLIEESVDIQDRLQETRAEEMVLNMGPSHPAMHGIVQIVVKLQGEKIIDADMIVGYLHRGFAKSCEKSTWNQAIIFTDRLNYVSPIINNVGYCLAVEKLLDIQVPLRGQYIRTIACEISRVADHVTCIGPFAMEMGAMTVFLYLMKAREYLYDLLDQLCGARVTTNFTRVGGICWDLIPGFEDNARRAFKEVRKIVHEIDLLLTKNRIFIDRSKHIGVMKAEDAINWGFTGPCLRAAGVDYDVRKYHPYLVYDQVDFLIPVGVNGDSYDRYLCRMEEIEQSLRICEQCLDNLPDGPVNVLDRRVTLPKKEKVYTTIEDLMNHFKLIMPGHGIRVPKGEAYQAVEGGNGEVGFYVVSDGGDKPYRVRCRPPCLHMVAAMPAMIKGQLVADVIPTFGSVNMIGGELDR